MATTAEEKAWAEHCANELKFLFKIFTAEHSEFLPDFEEEYAQMMHEIRTCIFDFATGQNVTAARLKTIYDRCQPPRLLSLIDEKKQHEERVLAAQRREHQKLIRAAVAKSANNAKQQEYWRKRKQAVAKAKRDAQKGKP